MHMADALLSPAVGGLMWSASAAAIAFSSAKVRSALDERKVPLMAVLGAFVFAAQMINFSIPGTGSSGHLGGGLLLAILLGPSAAFLTIASVLVVQALFFADGGLLALGCNIFNMAFLPAFLVFPLCYRSLIGAEPDRRRFGAVTILSSLLASQLGPLAVAVETVCSGVSALPVSTFLLLMQPVHLALGLVEGMVTVAVVSFVGAARPDMVKGDSAPLTSRKTVAFFLAAALVVAGVFSTVASKEPDVLEAALGKGRGATGQLAMEGRVHHAAATLQQATAWFPDYQLRHRPEEAATPGPQPATHERSASVETGMTGIAGSILTLLTVFVAAYVLKKRSRRRSATVAETGPARGDEQAEVLPGGTGY